MNTNPGEEQALACDLTAIPANVREEHVVSAPQLFATAQQVQELADGYAIRFVNEAGSFMKIAKFIENERLCCPFFHFGLELEPNGGPIWLRLTGGAGVKEMIQSVLLESRNDATELQKAIRTGDDPGLDAIIASTSFPLLKNTPKKD
jgi:hypothetical protein